MLKKNQKLDYGSACLFFFFPACWTSADIDKFEFVQKLARKICTKNWSASYSDQLHVLNLPTTGDCRLFLRLCTVYKILNKIFSVLENIISGQGSKTPPMSARHVSTNSLYTLYVYTNPFMNSFVLKYLNSIKWPHHHLFVYL